MKNLLSEKTRRKLFKTVRKSLGLTQAAMSEKLHISERAYSDLERGRRGLSAATLLYFLMLLSEEGRVQFLREIEHELEDDEE